ncbi:host attachment protein (plasmid) [Verrucomicrobiaceae bacterium 227]
MKNTEKNYDHLLILTDLGTVRVLNFEEAGDQPRNRAHLRELSENELEPPTGAETTDDPGKFNRGFAAGKGEAMSHAETKLDMEIEKRAIAQVAEEICAVVANLKCNIFTLAAPQEHLNRLEAVMDAGCLKKLNKSLGSDLTKTSLKELETRFL